MDEGGEGVEHDEVAFQGEVRVLLEGRHEKANDWDCADCLDWDEQLDVVGWESGGGEVEVDSVHCVVGLAGCAEGGVCGAKVPLAELVLEVDVWGATDEGVIRVLLIREEVQIIKEHRDLFYQRKIRVRVPQIPRDSNQRGEKLTSEERSTGLPRPIICDCRVNIRQRGTRDAEAVDPEICK